MTPYSVVEIGQFFPRETCYQTTRCHISKGRTVYSHHREVLKSRKTTSILYDDLCTIHKYFISVTVVVFASDSLQICAETDEHIGTKISTDFNFMISTLQAAVKVHSTI